MILKGSVEVRQAGVAGIPGFSEQTQIRQGQHPDYLAPLIQGVSVNPPAPGGVDEHQPDGKNAAADKICE